MPFLQTAEERGKKCGNSRAITSRSIHLDLPHTQPHPARWCSTRNYNLEPQHIYIYIPAQWSFLRRRPGAGFAGLLAVDPSRSYRYLLGRKKQRRRQEEKPLERRINVTSSGEGVAGGFGLYLGISRARERCGQTRTCGFGTYI